jgi:hypothetical protein
MATSAVWEVLDALVALFAADATLAAAGVRVVDGPPTTDLSPPNLLFVGSAPSDPNDDSPDASFSQSWGELGARAKYEDLIVRCELWVRSGSQDMAARRDTAKALLDAIEAALRTNYTLAVGRLLWIHLAAAEIRQIQTQAPTGSTVAVSFTLAGRARLS